MSAGCSPSDSWPLPPLSTTFCYLGQHLDSSKWHTFYSLRTTRHIHWCLHLKWQIIYAKCKSAFRERERLWITNAYKSVFPTMVGVQYLFLLWVPFLFLLSIVSYQHLLCLSKKIGGGETQQGKRRRKKNNISCFSPVAEFFAGTFKLARMTVIKRQDRK